MIFKGFAEIQNGHHRWAQKLKKLNSEIILQSHSPRYGDVQVFFLRFNWNSNLTHYIRAYTHHLKICRWNLKWPPQVDFLNICDRSRSNGLGIWHSCLDTLNLHNVVFSFRVHLSSKRTNFPDLSAIFLNSPDFSQISKIPWPISKFPDFSLTLNFPDQWQPCSRATMSKVTNSSWPVAAVFNFGRHIGFWSRNKKHPYQNLILIWLSTFVQIVLLLSKNARSLCYAAPLNRRFRSVLWSMILKGTRRSMTNGTVASPSVLWVFMGKNKENEDARIATFSRGF